MSRLLARLAPYSDLIWPVVFVGMFVAAGIGLALMQNSARRAAFEAYEKRQAAETQQTEAAGAIP